MMSSSDHNRALSDSEYQSIIKAANSIKQGKVIAYPTEYCFGLGCDLLNQKAVEKILTIKQRDVSKGLIIIADTIEQLSPWITVTPEQILKLQSSWPAPLTWLVPKSKQLPSWISGDSDKVAVRVADHKLAREICKASGTAIVSTSCNPAGLTPAKNAESAQKYFPNTLDYIVDSPVGDARQASTIRDLISDTIIR